MKLKYVNNDDQHAYYLDGVRAKGVTTVASIPDNRYNLERHGKRMVAIGLAENPVYVEAVAAHVSDKNELDGYVDKAYEAAKASHGAVRGTAVHRFTERHDLGEPIIQTPLATYVVASWTAALDAADLEVIPEYVERIVVYPDRRICGRFDRILRNRTTGVLHIADVKGGENALRYPHSMTSQCALYANAPLIAGPIPNSGGETTTFDPMPDVDKQWAYIFHIPESGQAAVAKVDIAAGWDITTRAIFPVLDWRDRKDLCHPVVKVAAAGTAPRDSEGGVPAPVASPVEQATPTRKRRTLGDEIRARTPQTPPEPLADPADTLKLERRFAKLPDNAKAWINGIVKQAHDAGHQLNLSFDATVRTHQIGLALVRFATLDPDDRLLTAALHKIEQRTEGNIGFVIANLRIEQAEALNALAVDINDGKRTVLYTEDGVQLPAA